jgi:hypothetical protein
VPFVVHAMQIVHTYADELLPLPNYLPIDAQLLCALVKVTAAYNAASTNVLTIGTNSSSYNNIAAAGDIDEATTGADVVWTGVELDLSAAEALPYVKYTQSGDAATAGRSIITLLYIPKIDRA